MHSQLSEIRTCSEISQGFSFVECQSDIRRPHTGSYVAWNLERTVIAIGSIAPTKRREFPSFCVALSGKPSGATTGTLKGCFSCRPGRNASVDTASQRH